MILLLSNYLGEYDTGPDPRTDLAGHMTVTVHMSVNMTLHMTVQYKTQ